MPHKVDITKYCGGCKKDLKESMFVKSKFTKDGLSTQCGKCNNLRGKLWRLNNPDKNKDSRRKWENKNPEYIKEIRLQRAYKIGIKEFNRILKLQDGLCDICKVKLKTGRGKDSAHLDHNHITNKIRGILCHRCNHGLGNFMDSRELLAKSIIYLIKHESIK